MSQGPKAEDLELNWSWGRAPACFDLNHEIPIVITVTNKSPKPLSSEYYVKFNGNQLWSSAKEYVKGDRATFNLRPLHNKTVADLPSSITFSLYDPSDKRLVNISTGWGVENFCGEFRSGSTPVNLLLFGVAGSTKSSFINAALSAFSSELQYEIAQSGGSTSRVTTEFTSYRLGNLTTGNALNIRVWDTWGVERSNYQDNEFPKICRGQLPRGTKLKGTRAEIPDEKVDSVDSTPHCMIFFIPAAELETPDGTMFTKTREFIQIANSAGISWIVVLTKMDAQVPAFRQSPMGQHDLVEGMRLKAANILCQQPYKIWPLINYWSETTKNFDIDRLILRIVQTAFNIARGRMTGGLRDVPSTSGSHSKPSARPAFLDG